MKNFDLNIEDVLENWEPFHAIREVIANALDERLITGTADIEIDEGTGGWHIRDFGRGIRIEHFTMNENPEKLDGVEGIIGKFGVGLKDALATFNRNGISPVIKSAHGTFTIAAHSKFGFDEISTLHVEYDDTPNQMIGTDIFLEGVTESQIVKAKDLFLQFSNINMIETTKFGTILESLDGMPSRVYINGVLANEEGNFLFSYNITKLTKSMRKALNRERTNVGRATYTDRIKAILKAATSEGVLGPLANQVQLRSKGDQCDEVAWSEVAQISIQAFAERDDSAIFITEDEMLNNPDEMERMQMEGKNIITLSSKDREHVSSEALVTFDTYVSDWNESFEFQYVDENELNKAEKDIFSKTEQILALVGWKDDLPTVLISETMQKETDISRENGIIISVQAVGLWQPLLKTITIKRSELCSLSNYAGILLHEAAHASSGASDVTRRFENELTSYIGYCADEALDSQ